MNFFLSLLVVAACSTSCTVPRSKLLRCRLSSKKPASMPGPGCAGSCRCLTRKLRPSIPVNGASCLTRQSRHTDFTEPHALRALGRLAVGSPSIWTYPCNTEQTPSKATPATMQTEGFDPKVLYFLSKSDGRDAR